MGAFAGSLSMCQQITEALSSVVNHNALKIELFFFFLVAVLHICCKY